MANGWPDEVECYYCDTVLDVKHPPAGSRTILEHKASGGAAMVMTCPECTKQMIKTLEEAQRGWHE